MGAAKMEFEGVSGPQEEQAKVAAASALHEWRKTPEADAAMQMRTAKDFRGR
jgi:hypothetical protein